MSEAELTTLLDTMRTALAAIDEAHHFLADSVDTLESNGNDLEEALDRLTASRPDADYPALVALCRAISALATARQDLDDGLDGACDELDSLEEALTEEEAEEEDEEDSDNTGAPAAEEPGA
jgi:prefoldin subunit 5